MIEQGTTKSRLSPNRCFSPDPAQRRAAIALYERARNLPLICPHGHVDPRLLADENATWGTPASLLIIPDHYVFRMLYSQGISLDDLGVPHRPEAAGDPAPQVDHREIWQRFADNFYLFRGTPTGYWLSAELADVFGVTEKLNGDNAQAVYDQIEAALARPEFRPRAMFERFNIEVLCTTDAATDTLDSHVELRRSAWGRNANGDLRVRPCFRPDAVVNITASGWRQQIERLSEISRIDVSSYPNFIAALQQRRTFFKQMGATATDHAVLSPCTTDIGPAEAGAIFRRALRGEATAEDAVRFTGHMLMEMARMSIDDGLVMQLHAGSHRNHNAQIFERFGLDKGADIPVATEWTENLRPLLNRYGNDPRLTLVLFTLDESTYSRELAPLAGHYPALRLGPPWWFHDSYNGMRRYFDLVTETAGLYNTAGFNDDTRAFPSIPARHDLWRRTAADWLAGMLVRDLIDEEDAQQMIVDVAYGLAKKVYRL